MRIAVSLGLLAFVTLIHGLQPEEELVQKRLFVDLGNVKDYIKDKLKHGYEDLKETVGTVKDKFGDGLDNLMDFGESVKDKLKDGLGGLKNLTSKFADKVKEGLNDAKNKTKTIRDKFKWLLQKAYEKAKEVALKFRKNARRLITAKGKVLGEFFESRGGKAAHFFVKGLKLIKHVGKDIYTKARDEIKKRFKDFDFEKALRLLVKVIDSTTTKVVCTAVVAIVISSVGTPVAGLSTGILQALLCKAALHLVSMGINGVANIVASHKNSTMSP